jgi:hypothetical protein
MKTKTKPLHTPKGPNKEKKKKKKKKSRLVASRPLRDQVDLVMTHITDGTKRPMNFCLCDSF